MSLVDFAAKNGKCSIELVGGHTVDLTFRPFTLADLAWLENEFDEKDAIEISKLKSKPICKIIWNQLTVECQQFFSDVRFEKLNEETGEKETVKLMGYQKLMHSLKNGEDMLIAWGGYSETADINSFIPDEKKKMKMA